MASIPSAEGVQGPDDAAAAAAVHIDSDSELGGAQPQQDQSRIINELLSRIAILEERLTQHPNDAEINGREKYEKLKPIDIKDIERPDKYDNQPTKFNMWYDKFKDLLTSRNENWGRLLVELETRGKATIKTIVSS